MTLEPLRSRRGRFGLLGVLVLAMFVAAVVPTGGTIDRLGPLGLVGLDHWLHVLGYFLLEVVVLAVLSSEPELGVPIALTPVLVVGYGVVLEVVQAGIAYRQASGGDVVADAAGALLALGCWVAVDRMA